MQNPLQTLVSQPGKHTSHITPISAWLEAYTTWVLLNLITGTYTNREILLILNTEDTNIFPYC